MPKLGEVVPIHHQTKKLGEGISQPIEQRREQMLHGAVAVQPCASEAIGCKDSTAQLDEGFFRL